MLHCPACALRVWWRTGAVRCVMQSVGPGVHRIARPSPSVIGAECCTSSVALTSQRGTWAAANLILALHCTALHGRARRSALCSCCSGSCCLERAGCSLTGACAPWQHTAVHLYRPACAAVLGASRIVSAQGPFALEPNPSDKQTNNQPNPRASRGRTLSGVLKRPRSICTTRRANTRLCTHGTHAWHAGTTRCARMRMYSCTTRVSTRSQRHART